MKRFWSWLREQPYGGLVIGCVVAFLFMILYGTGYVFEQRRPDFFSPLTKLEFYLTDLRFQFLAEPGRARDDIVVLAITEETLSRYREQLGRWPWPRRIFAALFRHLGDADRVLVDVGFWEPSRAELTPKQATNMKDLLQEMRRRLGTTNPSSALKPYSRLLDDLRSLAVADDRTLASYTDRFGPVHHAMTFTSEPFRPGVRGRETVRHFFDRYGYRLGGDPSVERYSGATLPIEELIGPSAPVGHINFEPDPDGPARRFSPFLGIRSDTSWNFAPERPYLPILGMAGSLPEPGAETEIDVGPRRITVGDTYRIPLDRKGKVLIHYRGASPYRVIPVDYLIQRIYGFRNNRSSSNVFSPEWFEGKKVLIGATAPGLFDLRATPFGSRIPGVLNHAHILDMMLSNHFMRPIRLPETLAAIAALTLGVAAAATFLSPVSAGLVSLVIAAAYVGLGIGLFERRVLINLSTPLLSATSAYLGVTVFNLLVEQKKRRQIKNVFQHYLSPSVLQEVLKEPDKLELGGQRREISVLFADVAGFTTFSEGRSASEVASVINGILTDMTRCVFQHEGVLDKYIGDALVAEFGIVSGEPNHHARRACFTALDMRDRMEERARQWEREGKPVLDLRIGVHTGEAATGNMGSEMLFDYTAIGDTMNLASRLEGANKQYGTSVTISESTYRQVQDEVEVKELDRIVVKGKDEPVTIYELLSRKGELTDTQREHREMFERGLSLYRRREWKQAMDVFETLRSRDGSEGPAGEFLQRCRQYRDQPPPPDWDGVFRLTSK